MQLRRLVPRHRVAAAGASLCGGLTAAPVAQRAPQSSDSAEVALPTNAALRRVFHKATLRRENALGRGVPLADFLATAEKVVANNEPGATAFVPKTPGATVASTALSAIYTTKRGVTVHEPTGTVHLEANTYVKHAKTVLRAVARMPPEGMKKSLLRSWLTKLSNDEFEAAITRVFDHYVRVKGDMVYPVRAGSDVGVQAAFQTLTTAPDDGLQVASLLANVQRATKSAPTPGDCERIFRELAPWLAPLGAFDGDAHDPQLATRLIGFCDWETVVRRALERLPPEGALLPTFLRYVLSEGSWSQVNPPNVAAVVTLKWLQRHFSHLCIARVAATDGVSVIVAPIAAIDTPGAVQDCNTVIFADPTTGAPATLPVDAGWRDLAAPAAALEALKPAKAAVGTATWEQFCIGHPAFEVTSQLEVRPHAARTRAIVYVDGAVGGPERVNAMLESAGVFDGTTRVEWGRVGLRSAKQPAISDNDVVSPAWLELHHVLAAQLSVLSDRVEGAGLDFDRAVVVVADADSVGPVKEALLEGAGPAFKGLTIVAPDGTHVVRGQ